MARPEDATMAGAGVSDQVADDEAAQDQDAQEQKTTFIGQDRESALEALAGSLDKQRAEEFIEIGDDGQHKPFVPEPEQPETDADAGAKTAEGDEAPPADDKPKDGEPPAADDKTVEDPEETLIIDGKEQKVPRSKIFETGKRALQKEIAADKRLEEATELLRRAEAAAGKKPTEAQQATGADARPSEQDAARVKANQAVDVELASANFRLDAAREALADATSDLDKDRIKKAQIDLEKANREVWKLEQKKESQPINAPIDVNKLTDDVVTRTMTATTVKSLQDWSHQPVDTGGLADMYEDPRIEQLFHMESNRLIKEGGKDWLSKDTYVEAAKSVRELLGKGQSSEKAQQEKSKMDQRRDAKRKLDNVKGVNAKAPSTQTDDQPATHEQMIQEGMKEMRKGRIG